MTNLNEFGATAVPAAMAPWAMKSSLGYPYTQMHGSTCGKKATGQFLPSKASVLAENAAIPSDPTSALQTKTFLKKLELTMGFLHGDIDYENQH